MDLYLELSKQNIYSSNKQGGNIMNASAILLADTLKAPSLGKKID